MDFSQYSAFRIGFADAKVMPVFWPTNLQDVHSMLDLKPLSNGYMLGYRIARGGIRVDHPLIGAPLLVHFPAYYTANLVNIIAIYHNRRTEDEIRQYRINIALTTSKVRFGFTILLPV